MKQSPLHDRHCALGAQFERLGDWDMPAHYGDPIKEHLAVRQGLGIADLSARGKLLVVGDDRISWLQSILSNDLRPLQPGQGLYSTLMSHKGKILTYVRVYVLEDSVLLEDVGEIGDTTFQTLRKYLLYGTKAKLRDSTESWSALLVSGHNAPTLLAHTFSCQLDALTPLSFVSLTIEGQHGLIARTEETGELDYEILAPAPVIPLVWDRLWATSQSLGLCPFGTRARESLRIEAGLPRLGPDLNERIVPPEANLEGKAFSLAKGCYPGQEVVARMDTYGSVKRRLVGLVFEVPEGVVPPHGSKLFSGDREVGWVSSAVYAPTLQRVIGLGFPLRDFTAPGVELSVELDGSRYRASVQALPFYRPS
ncbi:MAG: aminomethyl transferase family protein [Nitrospirae bacterium]|nr:MAG: aminomethyl transferase family protein [Nitrospirota bacterium]